MGPLGWQETIFIFLLALLIFGPKKLPELGRNIGKALTEFRRASSELRSTFDREMANIERETAGIKEEAHKLTGEINSAYYDNSSASHNNHDDYSYSYDGYSYPDYTSESSDAALAESTATGESSQADEGRLQLAQAEGTVAVGDLSEAQDPPTVVSSAESATEKAQTEQAKA
jgi:sec-independent protein translocase protein TatA